LLDKKLIFQLYKRRHTQAEIARTMGVTRQRIHQILRNYQSGGTNTKWRIKMLENDCQICYDKAVILHHIDHNSHNNSENNLLPVCCRCHIELHRGGKHNTFKHVLTFICRICGKRFQRPKGWKAKGYYCSYKCMGKSQELKGKWSRNYSECVVCHRNDIIYQGQGMCNNCYARYWYRKNKKENEELL
jgi:hypothetical protein